MRVRIRFLICALLMSWIGGSLTWAVTRAQPRRTESAAAFECRWADTPIMLDGVADEPAWKHAQVIDQFALPWLGDKAQPARSATKARLLWDREYLYFFAEMSDDELFADVIKHNGPVWTNDAFALYFKPAADKPGYGEIQVNAAGAYFDCFHAKRGDQAKDGSDFTFEAVVKINGTLNKPGRDKGWSVEGRIAWIDFLRLGGRPEPGESWRFALCRYDVNKSGQEVERSTCAPLRSKNPPDFHAHEEYASLAFVGPDQTKTARPHGIEKYVPVTTSTVVGSPDPPPPYRAKRVYPQYSPSFPIMVRPIPGADQLLLIAEQSPYAPTSLVRIAGNPATKNADAVKILDFEGVAYDIAFHPKFAENGFVYIGWNAPDRAKKIYHTRITRYTMSPKPPFAFDLQSAKTIIEWESNGHNGGAVCFGHDGMMYVTSGDGTLDSDLNLMGQRTDALLAKVLRIDVDHPEGDRPYSIPKDNPFVGDKRFRPETWAYGLRNPWRITCDEKTGHIWVGNNGQDQWEQAYFIRRGENYGWSVMEGGHPFYPNRQAGPTPIVPPTIDHPHSEFRSLTGGVVYYGQALPELRGMYIYGDYSTGRIWGARHDGNKLIEHREIARTILRITGLAVDGRGELLICDHQSPGQGAFYTLEPTSKESQATKFPRKLSESGLFASVRGHRVVPGVVPYSVNAPFWSDGLYKERFLAMPADGKIEFTHNRGWNFPDKTVLIKSFALEQEEGNPASRKWVETRFLTKQAGEWLGYSYVWNEDQSDAELVPAPGMDRDFTIRAGRSREQPAGTRTQRWHYPSRTECMVCHTRAANFVLGLSELQMNKEHEYPSGVRDNQLRVLEHLGLLSCDWAREAKQRLEERARSNSQVVEDYVNAHQPQAGQRLPSKSSAILPQPAEQMRALVDPYDASKDLTLRARSWLHANCSTCHVESGGGNAQMELEFTTDLDKMRVLNTVPLHQTFGLPDAKLIAPGNAKRSVLAHRASLRGPGQMPPLSSNRVDIQGVELLRAWINSLKEEK